MTEKQFLDLSIADLSRITGDYPSSWFRWLKGERQISTKSLFRASEKLGIRADRLLRLIKERGESFITKRETNG